MKNHEKTFGSLILWTLVFLGCMACCVAVLSMAGNAYGIEWHTANQIPIAWDAPTELTDGRAVPADNLVHYSVYIVDKDRVGTAEQQVDNHPDTTFSVTFSEEGSFFVGVQAIRKLADGTEVGR